MDKEVNIETVWGKCLELLMKEIPVEEFEMWIRPIRIVRFTEQDKGVVISVPSEFHAKRIDEDYIELILRVFTNVYKKRPENAYYELDKKQENKNINTGGVQVVNNSYVPDSDIDRPFFNTNKNFDSFIEGNSNRMARNAGITISENPGATALNPFFIFGKVGLGKTHLMNAIGLNIQAKFPKKKVLLVEAEEFTKQYVNATMRDNKKNDFIHFYQQVDVLFIDNVQFMSDKAKTQDAFFHIFNYLHTNGKQVILTSDRSPAQLEGFTDRLLSRFKWGLSAELEKPNFEMRKTVLKQMIKKDGIELDSKIIEYIAKTVNTNIRELEGVVTSIIAESLFNKKDIDMELVKTVVERIIHNENKEINEEELKVLVAEHFGIDPEKISSKGRAAEEMKPRHVYMYLLKTMFDMPLKKIGTLTGGRTHSTVISGCKNAETFYKKDIDEIMSNMLRDA